MWVSRASFCSMSGSRPLVSRLGSSETFDTITPTCCPPSQQQQHPQRQPIPYLPSLRTLHRSGLSCLSTWTSKDTPHSGSSTTGSSSSVFPGPLPGDQMLMVPDFATPAAVWRDRLGMVVVGETREKLEAACGLQGAEDLRIEPREDDGIVSVSGTSTDLLKISRLCINQGSTRPLGLDQVQV